jgi:5-methylcytosine-specific restriction protein A
MSEQRKAWDKQREYRKLTGRPWRRLREQVLVRDKRICQPCLRKGRYTEATEVDHIKALANGGDDRPANLQAICGNCHKAKTLVDAGVVVRPTIGVDGWPKTA